VVVHRGAGTERLGVYQQMDLASTIAFRLKIRSG